MDTMPIELQISNLRVEANAHRVKAAECDEKADELEEIKNDPIRRMQMEIDGLKDRIKELSDDEARRLSLQTRILLSCSKQF